MSKKVPPILLLAAAVLLNGCASYTRIANPPSPRTTHTVQITAKPMSKMSELPVGAYYDAERQIIVSGHQKGLGVGLLFGVVGVMVADGANRSAAKARFGDATSHSIDDLRALTETVLADVIAAHPDSGWNASSANGDHLLQLSPYALFTVRKSGKARLFAMLRAEIPGSDQKPIWSTRYFARAPGEYPIESEDGWMADERFQSGMRVALADAIEACLADSRGELTGTRKVMAKGVFPFLNTEKLKLPLIVVRETADKWVAKLAVGDAMVMAGTHVIDPTDFVFEDASFKDPR